ncbi:MAG: DUF4143 domain-containing protein [Candidatus Peribacteria bacterium]|jgi:predicted AAA+ superfamily ATPase|nr:DUF4143 domain-containing protein [Candidatus Peribacteria bacterium]
MKELSRTLEVSHQTIEKYLYVMKKSYTIALISSFWTNVRAELTKMPKVYFFDLGLRNAILKNFENILDRFDK